MNVKSYISSKAKKRKSAIHGFGRIAVKSFKKGEIFAVKSGHIIDKKTFQKIGGWNSFIGHAFLQISDKFFIGPLCRQEVEASNIFINHSCNPNIGIFGNIISVAMRDIEAGEELTSDYAIWLSDNSYKLKCFCKTANCRNTITGNDWKLPELQKRYKGFFSIYIQKKIDELKK